jgi:sulfur relay (sulfurtransferase) complex TusBCD TusD component (DsrE family)
MAASPRKLGILISVGPEHPNFQHGAQLAAAAINAHDEVFLYGLFACAFAAQRRKIPQGENALYGGLPQLNDVMASADRFVSFN